MYLSFSVNVYCKGNVMKKLSAILPLKTKGRHYSDNIARCDILFSSLRYFSSPDIFDCFAIIVPDDEFNDVQHYAQAWADFPLKIINENDYFSIFKEFSQRHQIRGWHRQQIIKLSAPAFIENEYFIVFDPDCFATQHFTYDSLIIDAKALTHYEPRSREEKFWCASSLLLKLSPHLERNGMWWTPAILSRSLCLNLQTQLEKIYNTDWRRVLLSRYTLDWTEYTLYWLNAEKENLLEKYHISAPSGYKTLHVSKSVWFAHDIKKWDSKKCFSNDGKGIFAVIQSNTHISPRYVYKILSQYFPIHLQPYKKKSDFFLKIAEFYSAITRRFLKLLHRL